jgi:glycolate oxidase
VVGYDLTRLVIGSEGTLAVITSITVRLIPKPAATRTMVAFFTDPASAVHAVTEILRSGIVPTALEFMDRLCLESVREEMGFPVPPEAGAMLLIEVDGDEDLIRKESERIREICRQTGALHFQAASGGEEAERLWEARRNVSPSVYKLRPDKASEDVVVPRTRMPDLVAFLAELRARYGLLFAGYGHAGDGNVHVNILYDKGNPVEAAAVDPAVRDLFKKVLELGGTLSGEHGVGITKAPYVDMEIAPPAAELMDRIKKAFDPNNILNPGKIFPHRS